jgi:fatty-acyl-CoA synthase
MPHEKWGETPCAFIEATPGQEVDTDALRVWCRDRLAAYKVPGHFVVTTIPRTSTGKIQKFALRERAKELVEQT